MLDYAAVLVVGLAGGWALGFRSGCRLERKLWIRKAQAIGVDVSGLLPARPDIQPGD